MENVIKSFNIKPMLDRAEYERVEMPKDGENINIQITDEITVKLIGEEVVRVSLARSAVANPERLFKLYVELSADVAVNRKYFDELKKPEEYFKNTPICRALVCQAVALISNMTMLSPIGPMITPPMPQV